MLSWILKIDIVLDANIIPKALFLVKLVAVFRGTIRARQFDVHNSGIVSYNSREKVLWSCCSNTERSSSNQPNRGRSKKRRGRKKGNKSRGKHHRGDWESSWSKNGDKTSWMTQTTLRPIQPFPTSPGSDTLGEGPFKVIIILIMHCSYIRYVLYCVLRIVCWTIQYSKYNMIL